MEMQGMEYISTTQIQKQTNKILCAECGTLIEPNEANLCVACIRNEVDITEGIPKQSTVHWCKGCERYLQPPNIWVPCALESKELLALCLKKLRGLSKVRLVDAGFIWTEPHSKRLKVKLTIQKEIYASTILEQVFIVEYIISGQQCEVCTRVAAQLTWKACMQVRQKVLHKRTFFWLEQLILKHSAHRDTSNIKESKDGIDFYYTNRSHALKMLNFLESVVPIRWECSEQLISTDIHTSTSNYKFNYSVEIVPLCKDDLVCLPTRVARNLGDISPICVVTRVGSTIQICDPNSLKVAELRPKIYFENEFRALCEAKDLLEFYIIDVQPTNIRHGKYMLSTIECALSTDLSKTFITRTHLGNLLKPGDHAMGYFLQNSNFNNSEWEIYLSRIASSGHKQGHLGGGIPDVVLIKKSYPNARKKNRGRNWRLKKLAKEIEDDEIAKGFAMGEEGATSKHGRAKKKSLRDHQDRENREKDYEMFLRDLEEDGELRGMVNLFKDPTKKRGQQGSMMEIEGDEHQQDDDGDDAMMESEDEPEADFPEIALDELLEDMDNLAIDEEL